MEYSPFLAWKSKDLFLSTTSVDSSVKSLTVSHVTWGGALCRFNQLPSSFDEIYPWSMLVDVQNPPVHLFVGFSIYAVESHRHTIIQSCRMSVTNEESPNSGSFIQEPDIGFSISRVVSAQNVGFSVFNLDLNQWSCWAEGKMVNQYKLMLLMWFWMSPKCSSWVL